MFGGTKTQDVSSYVRSSWYVIGLVCEKWGQHGGKPKVWGMPPMPLRRNDTEYFSRCCVYVVLISWHAGYLIFITFTHFAHSSKMGSVTRGFNVRLADRPCLVFDFRALWSSTLRATVPESQKLKMVDRPAWHRITELV